MASGRSLSQSARNCACREPLRYQPAREPIESLSWSRCFEFANRTFQALVVTGLGFRDNFSSESTVYTLLDEIAHESQWADRLFLQRIRYKELCKGAVIDVLAPLALIDRLSHDI